MRKFILKLLIRFWFKKQQVYFSDLWMPGNDLHVRSVFCCVFSSEKSQGCRRKTTNRPTSCDLMKSLCDHFLDFS